MATVVWIAPIVTLRGKWILVQLAMATAWFALAVVITTKVGFCPPSDCWRPLAWSTISATAHSLLGVRLLRSDREVQEGRTPGIHGGLKVLAIRYVAVVGLILAGLLAFPSQRTVFVLSWSGLFLILTVSEMIVFITGVKRL